MTAVSAPPAPGAARQRAPLTYAQWASKRRSGTVWALIIIFLIALYSYIASNLARAPAGMAFFWPPWSECGLNRQELLTILGLSVGMIVGITAVQDLVLRPLTDKNNRGEKVFFISSIAARVVFIGVLLRHHYGPHRHTIATEEDSHRFALMAVFYASYWCDLIQLWRRPDEFAKNFRNFMVPHHVLSFSWFTPWLLFAAPRGVVGAPIWNTVFIYLCAAVPNHTYKLISCWFRPRWFPLLMGPAVYAHWGILLASQHYYMTQCPCSTWGCWYPGTVFMLFGAWGMAIGDVPNFLDSIVHSTSKLIGEHLSLSEIFPLAFGKGRPARESAEGGAASAAPVTVELILAGRGAAGAKGAKGAAPAAAPGADGLRSRAGAAVRGPGVAA